MTEVIEPTDLAYLAAFIDGEGSICVFADRRWSGSNLRLCIYNNHAGVLRWINEKFGGTMRLVRRNRAGPWRPSFVWEISGRRALPVIEACLPYFRVKKEQAEIFLAVGKTVGKYRGKNSKRSKVKVPPEIVEFRRVSAERVSALNKGIANAG